MADIFISYSRNDRDFVQELCAQLEEDKLDIWVDWEDIPASAEWLAEIKTAIESSDNFVFVLSPASVASATCGLELAHAVEHHKRLVPVVVDDLAGADVPEPLRELQWLFFRPGDDRASAAAALIETVHTDLQWVRAHTRLLSRASEWQNQGRNDSFVLRGEDLRTAEEWLAQGGEQKPSPTKQQTEYILSSRQAATRQQRTRLAAVSVALIVSIALAVVAVLQRNDAQTATGVAIAEVNNRATAEANAVSEANSRATAEANAVSEARTRATAEAIAITERDIAVSRQLAAEAQSHLSDQLDMSLLLSGEAYRRVDTLEARSSLLKGLAVSPALVGLLSGHTNFIESAAFSPDGKILASASDDMTVRIWNVATHEPLGQLVHVKTVLGVAFSPDGKMLASTSQDWTVRLWDVATRQQLGEPMRLPATDSPSNVAFSPDGRMLASGGQDLRLWDVATHQPLGQLPGEANSMAFSPDGTLIAGVSRGPTVTGGSLPGSVQLFDIATRQPLGEPLGGHISYITSVAFSPDGTLLASGGDDGTILWDVASRRNLGRRLNVDDTTRNVGGVSSVAFSPDSKTFAAAVDDMTVRLWDVASGTPLGEPLRGHTGRVNEIVFSPDARTLASVSNDKTVRLWDVTTRQFLGKPLVGQTKPIHSLAFGLNGKMLASGSDDGTVWLWDVLTSEPVHERIVVDKGRVLTVAFSPDGSNLFSGGSVTVGSWDVATRQNVGEPLVIAGRGLDSLGHPRSVESLAYSPDGKTMASGSADGIVALWDLVSRQVQGEQAGPRSSHVRSVAFSPDGTVLAISFDSNTAGVGSVQLWDVATRKALGEFVGHSDWVASVVFSPDGRTLASGSGDQTVRLWDVATRQPLGEPLVGHTKGLTSLAFSPDGKTLASGSADKTVRLWDVISRQSLGAALVGHTSGVSSVNFSPDGKQLASGGDDGAVMLWNLDPDSWLQRACHIVNRNLSRVEWRQALGPDVAYRQTCPNLPLPE
jgi:WD40 repeat protein